MSHKGTSEAFKYLNDIEKIFANFTSQERLDCLIRLSNSCTRTELQSISGGEHGTAMIMTT